MVNEQEINRFAEETASRKLEKITGLCFEKDQRQFGEIDWIVTRNRTPVFFCEFKQRKYPSSFFETQGPVITFQKYKALWTASSSTGIPSAIILECQDNPPSFWMWINFPQQWRGIDNIYLLPSSHQAETWHVNLDWKDFLPLNSKEDWRIFEDLISSINVRRNG